MEVLSLYSKRSKILNTFRRKNLVIKLVLSGWAGGRGGDWVVRS